jgi:tetratricopeptide (TPR) repeat protein
VGNRLLVILSFVLLIGLAAAVYAEQEPSTITVNRHIRRGDELYKQFKHKESLTEYLGADEIDPNNYEVKWRIARAYTRIGKNAPKKEKEANYKKAMGFANQAVAIDSTGVEGHFRLAVAKGRLALFKGGKEKIRLSKDVKAEIDIVKQLDPNYHLAYHVIGLWHRGIANLSWVLKAFAKVIYGGVPEASNQEAVANLRKAVELRPDYVQHHVELGKTYVEVKDYEKARKEFEKALELPSVEEDDDEAKEEAKELLEDIK